MRTEFLCISVLRVASGPRVKLASCKSALNPPVVYSTDRSKAVVPVLVLLFVALWFILRGDLLYVLPCVILFLCFSVLLVLRLPRLGKRELILVRLVRLFDLCLFGFVGFLFLLVSGKGCGLLVLLFVALWFILRGDLLYVFPCVILFLCFSVLLVLRLPRLGEERANLSAFRTFVRICACLDLSVSSSSWGLGRAAVCDCCTPRTFLLPFFVIVALPGLFSYLFMQDSWLSKKADAIQSFADRI